MDKQHRIKIREVARELRRLAGSIETLVEGLKEDVGLVKLPKGRDARAYTDQNLKTSLAVVELSLNTIRKGCKMMDDLCNVYFHLSEEGDKDAK